MRFQFTNVTAGLVMAGMAMAWSALTCGAPANAAELRFDSDRTVVWRGRTQVVAFHRDRPAEEDAIVSATSGDANVLAIVEPAKILAGQSIGYVRVRGVTPGETRLHVGDAWIDIAVADSSSTASEGALQPELLGPASGSYLWGVMDFAASTAADGGAVLPGVKSVELQLTGGRVIAAAGLPREVGGRSIWRFEIDGDAIDEGPVTVTAVATDRAGQTHVGDSRRFVVIRPAADALIAGECEALITADWKARYEQDPPAVGSHPDASDGGFVANYGADPPWRMPVNVKLAGVYQMVVRARGDRAAGALPAVGVIVDRAQQPIVAANLIDEGWRRVAVGGAFELAPGDHVLTIRFLNDFYAANRADRNLYLDRYELLRIGDRAKAAKLASGSPMMSVQPASTDSLRVAFMQAFDGRPITGRMIVKGFCWQPNVKAPAPRVSLLVNGETVSTQQAMEPVFWLDAALLKPGQNTVQLTAWHPDGPAAMTPVQTVRVVEELSPRVSRDPRRFFRFDAEDRSWSATMAAQLSDRDRTTGHDVAFFEADANVTLTLPPDLAGAFDVYVDARGEGGPAPKVALTHRRGSDVEAIQTLDVAGWWRPREAGQITLKAGENEIELATTGLGDGRRMWLGSVILQERVGGIDRSPPRVRLRYPSAGQLVSVADVVIAEAMDDDRLTEADLLIDGVPQGLNLIMEDQPGRLVFPLMVGDLASGSHRVSVRVRDAAGNVGDTREIAIAVAGSASASTSATTTVPAPESVPTPFARATYLLNRMGFGPEPAELADVLLMGEKAYVADRLSRGSDASSGAGDLAAMGFAACRYPEVASDYHVQHRVIQQGISTDNPLRYRFVLFAQNHFSTWIRKTEAAAKWDEYLRFNQLGVAPFGELLLTSATSPAMLWYLDQQRSVAGAINENYAREIMELHTLGVRGGYTQADVTALANLLTGWGATDVAAASGRGFPYGRRFYFDPALNAGDPQQIIGAAFDRSASDATPAATYDRVRRMLEILASHPSTARHIATKLAEHYVATPAPRGLTDHLATTFTRTGGDLQAVLLAMLDHPDFWRGIDEPRLAKPMTYALRITRVSGGDSPWQVGQCLANSGVMLFDRATPDGYPQDDAAYADSNAMLQRWQFARGMEWTLWRLLPQPWIGQEREGRSEWARRLSQAAAIRLTGKPLSDRSQEACLQFAAKAQGEPWERALQLVTFVAQLPEASRY